MPLLVKIIGWVGALIVGGTGGYIAVTHEQSTPVPQTAWIEVLTETVTSNGITLQTGDEINVDAVITTSEIGTAVLHFPDSSTVTIEPETTLSIKENVYTEEDKSIVARIALEAGKLAFKITELTTSRSRWEARTGNAVAVVRGTEFTVWFEDGTSSISVTENTVSVSTINPETGEVLPGTEVIVTENQTAQLTNENASKGEAPSLAPSPREVKESPTADPSTQPTTAPATSATPASPATTPSPTPSSEPASTPSGSPTAGGRSAATVSIELVIISPNLKDVTEGDELTFAAVARWSDGRSQDVTKEAAWRVLGPIGNIKNPGTFTAKLDQSTSEYGTGSGAVVATWKDPASGKELLGQTEIFQVKGYVPENIERNG